LLLLLLRCGLPVSHFLAVMLDNTSGCRTRNCVMPRDVPRYSAYNGAF
jgi:hypothetical protein